MEECYEKFEPGKNYKIKGSITCNPIGWGQASRDMDYDFEGEVVVVLTGSVQVKGTINYYKSGNGSGRPEDTKQAAMTLPIDRISKVMRLDSSTDEKV